ncbi:MAG: homoserine kinase [Candidatus Acidiferrales bacterium]|jgi:homoserine kinase
MKSRKAKKSGAAARTISVRVPASTANLGAGFDCFGLALGLYLDVRARAIAGQAEPCRVTYAGEGSDTLPQTADNLIYRAAARLAEREGFHLPPLDLDVKNQIPLGHGLGSSAAAIVAGVLLGAAFAPHRVAPDRLLVCAAEVEGHADNVAAALYGGWVVAAKTQAGVIAVRRRWPRAIKALVVLPEAQTDTRASRRMLGDEVRREDAVFNLQRVALFGAALDTGRTDLLWEAMRDRLHQPKRRTLVPGLSDALDIPRQPGLLGVALSGSGPSVLALVTGRAREIGQQIVAAFARQGIRSTVRVLPAGVSGTRVGGRSAV